MAAPISYLLKVSGLPSLGEKESLERKPFFVYSLINSEVSVLLSQIWSRLIFTSSTCNERTQLSSVWSERLGNRDSEEGSYTNYTKIYMRLDIEL